MLLAALSYATYRDAAEGRPSAMCVGGGGGSLCPPSPPRLCLFSTGTVRRAATGAISAASTGCVRRCWHNCSLRGAQHGGACVGACGGARRRAVALSAVFSEPSRLLFVGRRDHCSLSLAVPTTARGGRTPLSPCAWRLSLPVALLCGLPHVRRLRVVRFGSVQLAAAQQRLRADHLAASNSPPPSGPSP